MARIGGGKSSSVPAATIADLAADVGRRLMHAGMTVAAAESLTAGSVVCALGAAPDASEWLRGGITAYAPEVKFDVLAVAVGPVVTPECAAQMASGAARLMGADVSVATTGVGGPGPQEGRPAGTVFLAVWCRGRVSVQEHAFAGGPGEVVEQATRAALEALRRAVDQVSP